MASKVSGVIEKINVSGTERAIASTAYGYCETAAGTAAKVVDMTDFKLYEGVTIHVKFKEKNSAANPTLNVQGTGAKPIVQYGTTAASTTDETSGWYAGAVLTLTYDGTSWVRDQGFNSNSTYSYMRPYGSTAGATAAKVGTAGWRFQLTAGKYFMFTQYYDNTAQSALTLNIGSTGAKPIYINGQPSSASNYTLPGGQYLVYYDGTNYYFRTDDKMTGNITGNAATATTATNLSAKPLFAASGNNITVTAGGKTSDAFTVPYATSAGTSSKLGSSNVGTAEIPIYLNAGTPTIASGFNVSDNLIPKEYLTTTGCTINSYDPLTRTFELTANNATSGRAGLAITTNKVYIPWGYYFILSCEIYSPVTATWSYDENTSLESGYTGNHSSNDWYNNSTHSDTTIPVNTWTKVWYRHSNLDETKNPNHGGIWEYTNFGIGLNSTTASQQFKIRNVMGYYGSDTGAYYSLSPNYAITNISRSGTTFTATRLDGSTFTFTQQDNNTTYTFANGTNGFTVTPSGGTAQTVTVTPSIANNITGSGTANYITKFTGTNTIGNSGLTTDTNNNLTVPGSIYFGGNTSSGKALFSFSATYPKYGIWYKDATHDIMSFSSSGNADSGTSADFAIENKKLYNLGSIVPNTGNTTGSVGGATTPVYVDAGVIKSLSYTIAKSVPSDAVFTDHYAWSDITGKPTKITLTGAVTGSVSLSSGELSLATTVNHNHDSDYVNVTGDTMTGDLVLSNTSSGDSPALRFTRNSTNTDWRIKVSSGQLQFASATNDSSYTTRAYFKDQSGDLVLNSIQFGNNTNNYINDTFYTGKSRFSYHASAAHASINTSGSGWLKVKIKKKASWMLAFTIRLYTSYTYYDYVISGYNYGGNHWHAPSAILLGTNYDVGRKVKFGYDDDAENNYSTLWVAIESGNYYGIDIFNVTNGHSQYISDIENMFEIIHEDELTGTQQGNDQTIYGPWRRNETVASATTATKFASAQSVTLTGDVTGTASSQAGWSIATTIGTGKVTNAMLAGSIANNKLTNSKITIAGNEVSLGGSLSDSVLRESLGLSKALRFVGVTTTDMTGGTATNHSWTGTPAGISNYTPQQGDVVINSTKQDEWVCTSVSGTTYTWERLGSDTSYKIVQSAVSDPTASTATSTTFIDTISQNANGVITVTKKTLPKYAGSSSAGGAATNATTTANTSDTLYLVGVKSGATSTLLHDTSITVKGNTLDAGIIKLHQGNAADPSLTGNARIEFDYGSGQPVVISYTPNDSYRTPAGLKIMGGSEATPAWLEVEGDIYAAAFKGNADTATSAGKWTTARTLTIGSTGKSVDGSGNVSWNLTEIGAAASSHTHPVSQLTWGGGVNLATTATANNQEWSIDLSPGTYTGTYWHVWSTPKSGSILTCHPDDRHVTMPGNIDSTSTSTGTLQVTGGIGATGQVTATRLAANGSNTAYNLYVNGPSYSNINAYMPYQLSLDNPKVSRKLTEHNTSSYRHWIVLLLPYQTATNTSINNYIHGNIHFKKTGGNIYDEVFISANLCYNQLKYRLETYGDGGENAFTPISCIYNGVKYFALKCYDHDNPWTEIYFDGYCISAYPGGNNTTTKPLTLPYIVNYKGNGTQSGSQTIVNTEINNSISTILTDSIVTTATRYYPYMNINGNATSVPWTGVSGRPTNLNQFTNGPGYVTSSGVTSITLKAGTGIKLDTDNTAITSTGTRTISINGIDATNGDNAKCLTQQGNWVAFNNYSHPTGDGNLHVPATGASNNGKVLKAGSTAGSISWGTLSASDVGALASGTTVTNVAISADTTTNKNYALVFGTTPSDGTSPTAAKTESLQKNSAKFYVNPSTGNIQATTFNGYTLAAASAKGVVTTIDTSANLPTSSAVKTFVEGKGYVTSSGVTSVTLTSGAGITVSNSGTAITSTGSRTISISGMDTSNGSTTAWLNQKGGWSTPSASDVGALSSSTTVTNVAISADITTNKNYAVVFGTTPSDGTQPTAAKTEGLQKNISKFYFNPYEGNLNATSFSVDESVTLKYNTTDSALEFIFA